MVKYVCLACNYNYDQEKEDPNGGIAVGTKNIRKRPSY